VSHNATSDMIPLSNPKLFPDDFDKFWSVAARLLPAPSVSSSTAPPSRLSSRAPSMARTADDRSTSSPRLGITNLPNDSQTSVAASLISTTPSDALSAVSHLPISDRTKAGTGNNSRAVPVRFHLSDNAPIVQEPVQPLLEDGRPATLQSCLSSLFPMLFPPPPAFRLGSLTTPNLATPVIHGTSIPLESEIGWLASTYTSADGW
jgi:autophagy-related protein 5